jgi:hypothetical protein
MRRASSAGCWADDPAHVGLVLYFDAFSSPEPVSTSLDKATALDFFGLKHDIRASNSPIHPRRFQEGSR